jgi:site-specific DNA-methyltransferase (adenine-specific)
MNSIVYNADCLEGMKQYPDKYFDLAICDIPYGINVGKMAYLKEVGTAVKQKNGSKLNPNKKKLIHTGEDWDNATPTQEYFIELCRVSEHQIIFGVDYVKWEGLGAGRIKWDKGVAEGVSFNRYETAYCSLIDNEVTLQLLWAGMCQAKSLSEPMTQQGNKQLNEKRIHPCHKPRLLYRRLLLDYAKPGFKICDTHVGAGSLQIECYEMGFDFTGWEISPKHFQSREKRFQQHISQLKLFAA